MKIKIIYIKTKTTFDLFLKKMRVITVNSKTLYNGLLVLFEYMSKSWVLQA